MSIQSIRPSWDVTRIAMARELAKRSRCSRDQVGAIITDVDNKIIGEGYNGPPAGFKLQEQRCDDWCPRARQKNDVEWVWSADMTHPSYSLGHIEVNNDGTWWVYSNNTYDRVKMERDSQWEARGFTKVNKPGFLLDPAYDDCPSLHAEANALITSDRSLRIGGTIYVTSHVCMGCAKLVANSGLSRVYVKTERQDKHRDPKKSYDFMRQCGLKVEVHGPRMRSNDGS